MYVNFVHIAFNLIFQYAFMVSMVQPFTYLFFLFDNKGWLSTFIRLSGFAYSELTQSHH